jgi:subtilisin family serine protease
MMLKRLWVTGVLVVASLCLGAAQGAPSAAHSYIVVLGKGADPSAVAAQHGKKYGLDASRVYRHALKGYAAGLTDTQVAALRADASVAFVSADGEVHAATHCIGHAEQCLSEGIDRIDGDLSSARSGDGTGVSNVDVAVLDTGTDADHPDLDVVGGANCINDGKSPVDDPDHQFGHGTHVGGVIGARDDGIGVVGIAPGARLWSVRVFNPGGVGRASDLICGFDWAAATRSDSDASNDIEVANLSGGGSGADDGNCGRSNDDALHLAVCNAVDAGIVVVAAAGNESVDLSTRIPAAYNEVLAVTALADSDGSPGALGPAFPDFCPPYPDDSAAVFSNFAALPDDHGHTVAAPGVCIRSAYPPDSLPKGQKDALPYNTISGTSMATPHAAGVAALCIASGACAGLRARQIVQKLVADAAAYNTNGANSGYGFQGDPLRPITGKYYGYLIRAALY